MTGREENAEHEKGRTIEMREQQTNGKQDSGVGLLQLFLCWSLLRLLRFWLRLRLRFGLVLVNIHSIVILLLRLRLWFRRSLLLRFIVLVIIVGVALLAGL